MPPALFVGERLPGERFSESIQALAVCYLSLPFEMVFSSMQIFQNLQERIPKYMSAACINPANIVKRKRTST